MTIVEMQERKRELGYSNEMVSQLSGVPLSTVQKILGGRTKAPRCVTIKALEAVLGASPPREPYRFPGEKGWDGLGEQVFPYGAAKQEREGLERKELEGCAPGHKESPQGFTENPQGLTENPWGLTENSPASPLHQQLVTEVLFALLKAIRVDGLGGEASLGWKIYPAPFPVYLDGEGKGACQMDLCLLRSPQGLTQKGYMGPPDWVMEVTSPATLSQDYGEKLFLYRKAGVLEYWIVHPEKKLATVYHFDREGEVAQLYSFAEPIPFSFLPGFFLRLEDYLG